MTWRSHGLGCNNGDEVPRRSDENAWFPLASPPFPCLDLAFSKRSEVVSCEFLAGAYFSSTCANCRSRNRSCLVCTPLPTCCRIRNWITFNHFSWTTNFLAWKTEANQRSASSLESPKDSWLRKLLLAASSGLVLFASEPLLRSCRRRCVCCFFNDALECFRGTILF